MKYTLLITLFCFLGFQPSYGQNYGKENPMDLVDNFIVSGQYEVALDQINLHLNLFPNNAESYLQRAKVLGLLGRFDESLQDFQTAKRLNPYAHLYVSSNHRAQEIAKKTYSFDWINKDNSDILMTFNKSPISMINYQLVIKSQDLEKTQQDLMEEVIIALEQKQLDRARSYLNEVVVNPNNEVIVEDITGLIELKSGHIDQALTHFNKAIKMKPDFALAYHNRSICYKLLREYELAKRDLDTAIDLNENFANFYFTKAKLNEELENVRKAKESYKKAITIDQEYDQAIVNYSMLLKSLGEYELAIVELNKAIELDPDKIENYFIRGGINLIYGEYEEALDDFDEYLSYNEDDPKALFNRGLSLVLLNRTEEACEDFSLSSELGYKKSEEFVKLKCENF